MGGCSSVCATLPRPLLGYTAAGMSVLGTGALRWNTQPWYHSDRPLIDGLPPSEDPDLYLVAEQSGQDSIELHAWDLAPKRYVQGPDGQALRRQPDTMRP